MAIYLVDVLKLVTFQRNMLRLSTNLALHVEVGHLPGRKNELSTYLAGHDEVYHLPGWAYLGYPPT
jgi:hypothetical protein